jgi:pseudouridine-5'-phosphate glycosidase
MEAPLSKNDFLVISDEVAAAAAAGKGVVALESTIISHGMPYPQNVETAFEVEKIVREHHCVPATIAIINGKIIVGAGQDQIDYLGRAGLKIPKASRRDLAALIAKKSDGATTVTTTMFAAAMAGIQVFATGGIGGVHRGAEKTMDISADLEELAKTDVMVVCAGCKSILDIGLTLEYLETAGVPVLGYRTAAFPAFFSRESGFPVDYRIESPKEAADIWDTKKRLGLKGGMLIANPVPEEHSMDNGVINEAIDKAVAEADAGGIKGKELTPFLLARIKDLTGGSSLDANIKLVYNNAKVAAQIAGALGEPDTAS